MGLRILRYIKATIDLTLDALWQGVGTWFSPAIDAYWAGCEDSRKSTSGILILFNNMPVYYKSQKQDRLSASTAVAELIALAGGPQQVQFFFQQIAIW